MATKRFFFLTNVVLPRFFCAATADMFLNARNVLFLLRIMSEEISSFATIVGTVLLRLRVVRIAVVLI
jgi:hypothetical protein